MEDRFIKEYYENYNEEGRLERRHQSIEFLTTVKYVEKYLSKGDKILEVGAGTGRYSLYFSRTGYQVDAVELVEHNIEVFRSKLNKEDTVNINQGNALDLNMYEDNTFDVTLVLGPMYHVYNEEDKNQVVKEALRVTKPGGYVCFAYITHDAVMVHWGLIGKNLIKAKENNMFTEDYKCISEPKDLFAMFHVKQFNELLNAYPVEHLHTVATDGVAPLFEKEFSEMSDEEFNEWLKYHFVVCERDDLIGFSSHVLYIGKKK